MSTRQAPRDLRASDGDRDRVLALLAEAVSDGRLTADEHAERVQRACTARTLGELADLTADLAVASAQPVRLDGGRVISGIFGPAKRDGRWVVPETLTVNAMFGEVEVDVTQAILQARHVQLHATVIGGRLRLVVPDGVSVVVTAPLVLGRRRGGYGTQLVLEALHVRLFRGENLLDLFSAVVCSRFVCFSRGQGLAEPLRRGAAGGQDPVRGQRR